MEKIFKNTEAKIVYALWLLATFAIILIANIVFKEAGKVLIYGGIAIILSGISIYYLVYWLACWKKNFDKTQSNNLARE